MKLNARSISPPPHPLLILSISQSINYCSLKENGGCFFLIDNLDSKVSNELNAQHDPHCDCCLIGVITFLFLQSIDEILFNFCVNLILSIILSS